MFGILGLGFGVCVVSFRLFGDGGLKFGGRLWSHSRQGSGFGV